MTACNLAPRSENTPSIGQTLALTQAECLCLTGVLQCVKTDRPGACSQGVVRVGMGGGGVGRGARETDGNLSHKSVYIRLLSFGH